AWIAQGSGIWLVTLVRQLQGTYYPLGDTRTPVIVSVIDLGVFLVLALSLRGALGHVAISWAVTGSNLAQMLLLWTRLGRRLGPLGASVIGRSALHTLTGSAPADLASFAVATCLSPFGTDA